MKVSWKIQLFSTYCLIHNEYKISWNYWNLFTLILFSPASSRAVGTHSLIMLMPCSSMYSPILLAIFKKKINNILSWNSHYSFFLISAFFNLLRCTSFFVFRFIFRISNWQKPYFMPYMYIPVGRIHEGEWTWPWPWHHTQGRARSRRTRGRCRRRQPRGSCPEPWAG